MDGGWVPPMKIGEDHDKMIRAKKRKEIFKSEIAIANLKPAPAHNLTVAPDGTMETFTQKRERLRCKFGSDEHKKKLRNRPGLKERGAAMGKARKGKKQSMAHLKKRMKAIHGDVWEPEA